MIVHAHLNPTHPAVIAYKQAQERRRRMYLTPTQRRFLADEKARQEAIEAQRKVEQDAIAAEERAVEDARRKYVEQFRKAFAAKWPSLRHLFPVCVEICDRHGATLSSVFSKSRRRRNVLCRHEVIAMVAECSNKTLTEIAQFFFCHHTTVIHAIRRWNETNGTNIRGLGTHWMKESSYLHRQGR